MTHLAYVNPPPEVLTAVAATKAACEQWLPSQVSDHDFSRPPMPEGLSQEAGICAYVKDPDAWITQEFNGILIAGIVFAIVIVLVVFGLGLHRLPSALFSLGCWTYKKVTAS